MWGPLGLPSQGRQHAFPWHQGSVLIFPTMGGHVLHPYTPLPHFLCEEPFCLPQSPLWASPGCRAEGPTLQGEYQRIEGRGLVSQVLAFSSLPKEFKQPRGEGGSSFSGVGGKLKHITSFILFLPLFIPGVGIAIYLWLQRFGFFIIIN